MSMNKTSTMAGNSEISLGDIKAALDELSAKMDNKDKKIEELLSKVNALEETVQKKNQRVSELESRVCELEEFTNEMKRYTLKNNVIISGLPIQKPVRAYAEVVSTPNPVSSEFSSESETVLVDAVDPRPSNAALFKSTRSQVVQFIDEKMGLKLEEEDICAAHDLKPGRNDKVPPLIVRFTYTSVKQDVMAAKRNIPRQDKLEFLVQMSCQSCVDDIRQILAGQEEIKLQSVDLAKEQLILDTTLTSHDVQQILESSGRRAVLMGMGAGAGGGHKGAAVVMMAGDTGSHGVARFIQVSPNMCIVDGTIDGLIPGHHAVNIHELGDLSDGCQSCGDVFDMGVTEDGKRYGDLCEVTADQDGRAQFRVESSSLKVWDVIGRSLVVHHQNNQSDERVACGIVARSAGLFQNPKRVCACDGIAVWDERDVPIAGPGRQSTQQAQAQL